VLVRTEGARGMPRGNIEMLLITGDAQTLDNSCADRA
jgi:hypothetical protein